jgi:hypothetical protein
VCCSRSRDVLMSKAALLKHSSLAAILAFGLLVLDQATAATELGQRAAISASVQESFRAGDFDRLESMSRKYRTEKSRTSSGLWNLSLFYAGLDDAMDKETKGLKREAAFNALEEKTRKWAQEFPDSPTGHLAHSLALIKHAWFYRGGGYASSVSPESWAPFKQYIDKSRSHLEKFKTVASVDPRWYETMMIIAKAQSWERSKFDALLNEALRREPLFYQTYFSALEYLLPKWYGNIQEIEDFAQNAVSRTKKQEGLAMYARIYWYASQTQFQNDIINNSLVEWPQMKRGFEDIIGRYPDAWNLNNYARFACLARDKPKTIELLKRIESAVLAEAWTPPYLKQECAQWAAR